MSAFLVLFDNHPMNSRRSAFVPPDPPYDIQDLYTSSMYDEYVMRFTNTDDRPFKSPPMPPSQQTFSSVECITRTNAGAPYHEVIERSAWDDEPPVEKRGFMRTRSFDTMERIDELPEGVSNEPVERKKKRGFIRLSVFVGLLSRKRR